MASQTSDSVLDLPSLLDLTIEQAAAALDAGHFTSADLVRAYLARIDEAASFRAVLQVNPDAVAAAEQLDQERAQTGRRSRLHGIPILVKDNIATSDRGLDVSAGSYALLGAKPAHESSVVAKLRAAGVIVLGKTNLSEWANFRGLAVSSGWSPRGGQTMGAYVPGSSPDGSSSGSAVAAALGLCAGALGTETWGSILDPAAMNNVVGYKPSRGLIANDGAIPISARQDVIGTLTRTVKDAAILVSAMAGRSDLDDGTWNIPFEQIPDFAESSCQTTNLSGMTIGVPRNAIPDTTLPAPIMASFEAALQTITSAGAHIVGGADFSAADEFLTFNQQAKGIVRASEFKRDIVRYLDTLQTNPHNIRSAEDIIAFTKTYPKEEYPERDIDKFLWTQAEGINVDGDKYKTMVKHEVYFGGKGGILGAMERHGLDVLVVPSSVGIANDLAAKMGFPAISVPLGFYPDDTPVQHDSSIPNLVEVAPGIPYCLTFITKAFSDAKLLQAAYAFEQLSAVRKNGPLPFQPPTTELAHVQKN